MAAILNGWFTVDTVVALKALDANLYQATMTFIVVREVNKAFRLDGTSGQPEDLTRGIVNTNNGAFQWFLF